MQIGELCDFFITDGNDGRGGGGGGGTLSQIHAQIQRGNRGSKSPWKITKLKGSFEILVRQHSMFGYHPPAKETPLKWRFAGGPMMATFSGSWILSTVINFKKSCQS